MKILISRLKQIIRLPALAHYVTLTRLYSICSLRIIVRQKKFSYMAVVTRILACNPMYKKPAGVE